MNARPLSEAPIAGRPLWRLHHLGYVVSSIEAIAECFANSIGTKWSGKTFNDPLQGVKVSFIGSDDWSGSALVELVEPAGANSPVVNFLQRGGGLHHLCYEVDQLEGQLEFSRSAGGVIVKQPLPAVAFDGRRIAWVVTKAKLLVELLEAVK